MNENHTLKGIGPTINHFSSITKLPRTGMQKAGEACGVDQAQDQGVRGQREQGACAGKNTYEPRWRAGGD